MDWGLDCKTCFWSRRSRYARKTPYTVFSYQGFRWGLKAHFCHSAQLSTWFFSVVLISQPIVCEKNFHSLFFIMEMWWHRCLRWPQRWCKLPVICCGSRKLFQKRLIDCMAWGVHFLALFLKAKMICWQYRKGSPRYCLNELKVERTAEIPRTNSCFICHWGC